MIILRNYLFLLSATLLIGIQLISCGSPERSPINKIKPGDKTNKNSDNTEKPTQACAEDWVQFLAPQPSGRQTTYQEIQKLTINGIDTIIAQSITHKTITESTPEKISWSKEIDDLRPRIGQTLTQATMFKTVFIDLCTKGVSLTYSDRPITYKPVIREEVRFIIKAQEFEVLHEKYIFSKGKQASEKDELDLWIGSKAPYVGLMFKSQRKYIRMAKELSLITDEKELQDIKDI